MRPVTKHPLAVAAGLATLAVVGVVACGGGPDANHRTCGLVHEVVVELDKKRPNPKVIKSKLGEIRKAARAANDRQLRGLAPSLTRPSSAGTDNIDGAAPLDFTMVGALAALQEQCRPYSSDSSRAPPTSGKAVATATRGVDPPA